MDMFQIWKILFSWISVTFGLSLRILTEFMGKNFVSIASSVLVPTEPCYKKPLPPNCMSLNSREGQQIFQESYQSGHSVCYFPLASQFKTQDEPAFCALTSIVIILNVLEIDPGSIWKGQWRWYDERMLLGCPPLKDVTRIGINYDEFLSAAVCNKLSAVDVRVDDNSDIRKFRECVQMCTKSDQCFLVVTYFRGALHQTGTGHFSPIGGYHPEKDMVLLLDTARFKYPPHWISLESLFNAMKFIDDVTGKPRGYFVLKRQQGIEDDNCASDGKNNVQQHTISNTSMRKLL